MDATHVDRIAKLFAARRSRRAALAQAGTGLAATGLAAAGLRRPASAQDATPAAGADGEKVEYLFLQSFRGGSVAPKEGAEGRYTLTLERGLGQTVYFSDRPERLVGAAPTAQFLQGLGFPPDNPPNAALAVSNDAGETEIAVVELYDPQYDEATHTATYEVAVLAEWEDALGVGLAQTPADLATFGERFGAAHLFIDDCADDNITCYSPTGGSRGVGIFRNQPMCWNYGVCMPCEPYGHAQPNGCATYRYWNGRCNETWPDSCKSRCDSNTESRFSTACELCHDC